MTAIQYDICDWCEEKKGVNEFEEWGHTGMFILCDDCMKTKEKEIAAAIRKHFFYRG